MRRLRILLPLLLAGVVIATCTPGNAPEPSSPEEGAGIVQPVMPASGDEPAETATPPKSASEDKQEAPQKAPQKPEPPKAPKPKTPKPSAEPPAQKAKPQPAADTVKPAATQSGKFKRLWDLSKTEDRKQWAGEGKKVTAGKDGVRVAPRQLSSPVLKTKKPLKLDAKKVDTVGVVCEALCKGESLDIKQVRLYWASPEDIKKAENPEWPYSEKCKIQLQPDARMTEVWMGKVAKHPKWPGTIAGLMVVVGLPEGELEAYEVVLKKIVALGTTPDAQ